MHLGQRISLAILIGFLGAGAASAQEKPATSRPIDLATGMLLYCTHAVGDPWTRDLCTALDKEAMALAKAANVRFVALTTQDTDATNKQKARDAGFDPANAVWVLVRIQRLNRVEKGWNIGLSADGIAIPQPADQGLQRRLIFTQGATLAASVSRRDAERAGKTLIQGLFEYFTKPRAAPAK